MILCLAVPAKIVEIKEDSKAIVDFGGVEREVSLQLVGDRAKVGAYVLVHVGFAIEVIDEKEAQQTLEIWQEIEEYQEI
jgi:hydrogenase expression/formation protein HypC